MAAFMSITEFATEFGTLSSAQTATATRLLDVVSDYIRARRPDVDATAAKQVCFEIVRDALNFGEYAALAEWDNETDKRRESGKFADAAAILDDILLPKHKRLLGILATVAARGRFKKCDY